MHALSTVYRAYGLDAGEERLRWRLGVDTKAVFWKSDTTGSLHPDMAMVLAQDYFDVKPIDLLADDSWDRALAFAASGHPIVLLIATRESGAMHWVVAVGSEEPGRLTVYDPLFDEPYTEDAAFWDSHVLTAWAIRPNLSGKRLPSWTAHQRGASDMVGAAKRFKSIK